MLAKGCKNLLTVLLTKCIIFVILITRIFLLSVNGVIDFGLGLSPS